MGDIKPMKSVNYSEEAERGLVASVLANGDKALDEIGQIIRPEHLFLEHYRLIYLSCFDLYAAGQPVGLLTLTHQLRENGVLDKVGGPSYISELYSDGCDVSSGVIFASRILHKERIRRTNEVLKWAGDEIKLAQDYAFCDEFEAKVMDLGEVNAQENLLPLAVENVKREIARFEDGKKIIGFVSGIPSWDYALNGIVGGRYYALAARPGVGKTAMAEQIMMNILLSGRAVLFFSQDMSAEMLLKRTACRMANVSFVTYEHGKCTAHDLAEVRDAIDEIAKEKLFILSPSKLTGETLRSTVRTYKRRHNIECVILDHVQLLDTGKDLREGLTKASIQIRQSATQSGVAHIILAHLNRDAKDQERPKASDIKEFDQMFGDCDALILLWAEKSQYENHRIIVNFTLAKNRYGAICEDKMSFYGPTMRFDKLETYGRKP